MTALTPQKQSAKELMEREFLRIGKWTALQVALYVVVPIATLVGYIVGAAWVVGHYR